MIYIDAGHGGTDSGAVSNGVKESKINVAVSNYLAKELQQQGIAYLCCRTNDATSKTVAERVNEANNYGAKIYISLHCNSSDKPEPNGTQTYIYKFGGEAEKIATKIQVRLQPINGVSKWERVEDENFYVLRKTTMPAVLVEMGFISNEIDRKYLNDANNQKYIAKEICKGVCDYLNIKYKEEQKMDYNGHWAEKAIKEMIDKKIMVGDGDGNFRPNDNITRAEVAQTISNLLDYLGK